MKNKKHLSAPYLFLFPGFVFLTLWLIYPMFKALQISFYDWNFLATIKNTFIGFDNYIRAFKDTIFLLSLKNTIVYAIVTVSGQLILGLSVALAIDRITCGKIFFRTAYYLPVVTSWVVCSLLFKFLFNASPAGLVNYALIDILHIIENGIPWLNEAGTAFLALFTLGIWKGVGWTMVIFLAALQSISKEVLEAAQIDGANEWQIIWYVIIPMLLPTIFLVIVMLTIGAFQTYIPINLITNGGPVHRTEVLLSYMYDQAFKNWDFGYASALSYILIILVFSISQIQIKLSNQIEK
ncbi:MAG TPA: sugar ABC transporter permease [Anaerolineaceae bacterium]|nr:sugar ABC transporter permease [Anaerolineaceae bacterium]